MYLTSYMIILHVGEIHTSQILEGILKLVNHQDDMKTGNQEEVQIGWRLNLAMIMLKGLEGFWNLKKKLSIQSTSVFDWRQGNK